jgi:hypothetical protein
MGICYWMLSSQSPENLEIGTYLAIQNSVCHLTALNDAGPADQQLQHQDMSALISRLLNL